MTLTATKLAKTLLIVLYPLSTSMLMISVIKALLNCIRLIKIAGLGSSNMYLVILFEFARNFFFKMFFLLSMKATLAGRRRP